jgi:ketosteroid isomerase-like protein
MNISPIIAAYFAADEGGDADAFLSVFSSDAIVHDEGTERPGHAAIRHWWIAAKEKYKHVARPIDAVQRGDTVEVRANVSGQFPNSPAILQYTFLVRDDKIVELEIH